MAKMISRKKFLKRYPYAFHLAEIIGLISSWPIRRVMKTPLNHTFQFKVGDVWDVLVVPAQNPRLLNHRNHADTFPGWQDAVFKDQTHTTTPAMRENSRLIVERFKADFSKCEDNREDLQTITLDCREAVVEACVVCDFGGHRNEQAFFIPHALVSLPLLKIFIAWAVESITSDTLQSAMGVLNPPNTSVPPNEEESLDMDSDEGWGEDDWDEEDDGCFEEDDLSVESQDAMVDLLLGSIGRDCTTSPDWFRPNSYAKKSHNPFNLSHIAAMWDRSEGQYSTVHYDDDVTTYTFYKEVTGEDERDVEVAQYEHRRLEPELGPIPAELQGPAEEGREALVEAIAMLDDGIAERYLKDGEVADGDIMAALRRLREEPRKLLETLQASSPGFLGAVTRVDGRGVRFVVVESTANLIDWWMNHPAHDFLGNESPIPEHLLPPRIQYDPKTYEITYSGIGSSVSSRHYKDDAGVRSQLQKQIRFSLRRLFVFYPHIANELLKAYFPDQNLSHEDLMEAASKEDPRFMVAQDLHNEGDQYAILENYRQAKFKHLRKLIARGITPGAPPQE